MMPASFLKITVNRDLFESLGTLWEAGFRLMHRIKEALFFSYSDLANIFRTVFKIMLLLLFEAGNQRYAIDARQVIEVVPWVGLYPAPPGHKAIAGLLNYHCHLTTVIDLGRLLQQVPSKPNFGSRIMLLPGSILNAATAPEYAGPEYIRPECVGLLADRVLETRKVTAEMLTPLDASHHSPAIDHHDLIHFIPTSHALIEQQELIYYLQLGTHATGLESAPPAVLHSPPAPLTP
jgi:chemotaxis-related protein WspB